MSRQGELITIEKLVEKDVDAATDTLLQAYLHREPTVIQSKVTAEELRRWALVYARMAARDGLSFVAKHHRGTSFDLLPGEKKFHVQVRADSEKQTGESDYQVVGFCFSFDFATEENIEDELDGTKYAVGDELIEGLIAEYASKIRPDLSNAPRSLVHIGNLGIRSGFEGIGLARTILSEILKLARASGFRGCVAETSSDRSLFVFENVCGFKRVLRRDYSTFRSEVSGGTLPYSYFAAFHGGCTFVEKIFDEE